MVTGIKTSILSYYNYYQSYFEKEMKIATFWIKDEYPIICTSNLVLLDSVIPF